MKDISVILLLTIIAALATHVYCEYSEDVECDKCEGTGKVKR